MYIFNLHAFLKCSFVFITAILSQNPPADCQNIIDDYSKGKLLMYEYKIQINRCMNKAKSDAGKWFDWQMIDSLLMDRYTCIWWYNGFSNLSYTQV